MDGEWSMNPDSRTRVAALIIGVTAGILALTVALVALRAEPKGQGRTTSCGVKKLGRAP